MPCMTKLYCCQVQPLFLHVSITISPPYCYTDALSTPRYVYVNEGCPQTHVRKVKMAVRTALICIKRDMVLLARSRSQFQTLATFLRAQQHSSIFLFDLSPGLYN